MKSQELPATPFAFSPTQSYSSSALADVTDRALHASVAKWTAGISPFALAEAYFDWGVHLLGSPGKQQQLTEIALQKVSKLFNYMSQDALRPCFFGNCVEPLPQDKRFSSDAWKHWPYNVMSQAFLLNQQWWHKATTDVRGVTEEHERVVEFATRQILDLFAPSNMVLTNPDVMLKTLTEGGSNLVRGAQYFLEDWQRAHNGEKPVGGNNYKVGEDIAVTSGKVVFRNRLIELIQYKPTTKQVRPEPILIVPAWIMKYYILDLSPHNSMVKYLTDQGYTVFMMSWTNPTAKDRDLGMEDYRKLGIMAAIDAVSSIVPSEKIHAAGYCLGGTLLTISAAAMARDQDDRLASLTLFAAQTDFTEAGELMLFINESQLTFLEDMMWEQGVLDTKQMAGAFQLLRSNDLIWSRMIHDYFMGERSSMNDLMTWNTDATRMPFKMHSEYLRKLFLNNDFAEGRYMVDGAPVVIVDIEIPIFSVGTERDHIAPWRSTYKLHLLSDTDITYVLASGGHNAGIVSEPGHPRRHYRVMTHIDSEPYIDADTWMAQTDVVEGSWWPKWNNWLSARSGEMVEPPQLGGNHKDYRPLCDAPGTYVFQE